MLSACLLLPAGCPNVFTYARELHRHPPSFPSFRVHLPTSILYRVGAQLIQSLDRRSRRRASFLFFFSVLPFIVDSRIPDRLMSLPDGMEMT